MSPRRVLPILLLAALACDETLVEDPINEQVRRLELRASLRMQEDPGDLRPQARVILDQLRYYGWDIQPPNLGTLAFTAPPKTIRVWRRSLDPNGTSCTGQVDVIGLEDYVKGVLPHEWITSWKDESLRAGAVAIRTYASAWVAKGGKYTCADLCDTTYSQVYKPSTNPVTNLAVDATKDQVLLKSGSLVFAEYSAENGPYPTFGGQTVDDTATCSGQTVKGHGRGMCQWGTQRWALKGNDYKWMALHYYPGATLWLPPVVSPDQGIPPKPDQSLPPKPDQGLPPKLDKGLPPKLDMGPGPKLDKGVLPPKLDGGPKKDQVAPRRDSRPTGSDRSVPGPSAQSFMTLQGGCALHASPRADLPLPLLLVIIGLLVASGRARRSGGSRHRRPSPGSRLAPR